MPGTAILWAYDHDVLPATVVRDAPDQLVAWVAPDAPRLLAVPVDGRELRDRPVPERFTVARRWAVTTWHSAGILRVATPGRAHSLSRFPTGWYANLEEPYVRDERGVTSRDHTLDVWFDDGGPWAWKDTDELAATVDLGQRTATAAAAIRAEGEAVVAAFERGDAPFSEGWEGWRPPAGWSVPGLPPDLVARAGTAIPAR